MIKLFEPIFYIIGFLIKQFGISINQGGFKIKFPKNMTPIELGRSILGTYEKDEKKLVKKYLNSSDSVLEMGACLGVVSLSINNILKDKTKQVSIEPNPEMLEYLKFNKEINHGKFHIETCIVSKLKEVEFFLGGESFLSSSTLRGGKKVVVRTKTLDELIKEYFEFTAIIMDIEGSELDFFRSFNLRNSKIRLIVWESHCWSSMLTENELSECYTLLRTYGFTFREKLNNIEAWIRDI